MIFFISEILNLIFTRKIFKSSFSLFFFDKRKVILRIFRYFSNYFPDPFPRRGRLKIRARDLPEILRRSLEQGQWSGRFGGNSEGIVVEWPSSRGRRHVQRFANATNCYTT